MDLTDYINAFKNWIDAVVHNSWFSTVLTIVLIAIACAILSHLTAMMLRRFLKSEKGPLPSVSIFVNIARVVIWVIGLSIVLSSCFNVNIGAAVTALGIGGIAISLGFQSTLANLIGGLQIIIIGLIEPGDRISVSGYEGIVCDVTWRHTTITTARDEKVVIPNSVINSEALVKLPPVNDIKLEITIKQKENETIESIVEKMEEAIKKSVSTSSVFLKKPKIVLIGMDHTGYKALVTFSVEKGEDKAKVVDLAMQAIDSVKNTDTA